MSSNPAIDDIMEMFDLGGKDSEESSDYSNTAEEDSAANPDFDELAESVGDSLDGEGLIELESNKFSESKETKSDLNNDILNKEQEQEQEIPESSQDNEKMIMDAISINDEEEETSIDVDNIFSNIDSSLKDSKSEESNIKSETSAPTIEEAKVSEEVTELDSLSPEKQEPSTDESAKNEPVPFDTAELTVQKESKDETNQSVRVKQGVKMVDGKLQWLLSPPTDKYKPFYNAKEEALGQILPGGQIPFEKYKSELREARVEVDIRNINLDEMHDKMREIQKWRERITAISMHVNEQYFLWDRFVEMLHGVLARTEYEKPALKQEGVVFQHMRDMELYNQELKALHSITNSIVKNLDSAWDMLSRSVTIVMNEIQRSNANRYESKSQSNLADVAKVAKEEIKKTDEPSRESSPKSMSIDDMLDDYDGLEDTASIETSSKQKGSQTCDWDSL